MARLTADMGFNPMSQLTIEVDLAPLERKAFGAFRWRLKLARVLIGMAARVLRCGITFTGPE
jgi:hypothetical protein